MVYDKVKLRKAYNYYHCKRDAEQFRHIEENYGIGTPTSVGFTPLIKKHIDVLVGEYLELEPELQISCKDESTVSEIMRDKQLKIHEAVFKHFKEKLENVIVQTILNGQEATDDPLFEKELEKIRKDVADTYVSEYEVAAQNILNYIKNSRDIDLKNKMREVYTDLLVGGMAYYRVRPSISKTNLRLEILNSVDTFVERNPNEFYLNKSPRAVSRKWMTRDQILVEYDDELTAEARAKLTSDTRKSSDENRDNYVTVPFAEIDSGLPRAASNTGILGGLEARPSKDIYGTNISNNSNLIPVYECEWIEYDSEKSTRHEGVKIGGDIYITRGESETIVRSASNPKECTLTINGIFFNDKNGDPFSMILYTMDLQDWLI